MLIKYWENLVEALYLQPDNQNYKMKSLSLKLTALALLSGITTGAFAQNNDNKINVVTSAVPFLRISPDARAGGMGDVGIATDPDANTSFWNLAKTPFAKQKASIGGTFTPWLKDLGLNDLFMGTLAGYYQLDETQAISGSFRYFSLGKITLTDNLGNDLQDVSPRELSLDLGYSRKLSDKNSVGVAARYIYSNLAGGQSIGSVAYKAGSAIAADLSFFHKGVDAKGEGLNYGVTLSNLGSKISYTNNSQKDFIPANLGLGVAYSKIFDETNKITFAADLNKLLVPTPPLEGDAAALANYRSKGVASSWFSSIGDAPGGFSEEVREFQASLGIEYSYNDQFAFRAGYFWEDKIKGNRKYFTAGVGVKYNTLGINFSYIAPSGNGINRNPLSNTLRIGLTFDFANSGAAAASN
jgi:hypothetical protein